MESARPQRTDSASLAAAWALAALTFAVFAPALEFDFVYYDDDLYILRNPWVLQGVTWRSLEWAFTTVHGNYWLPLTWISFMIDVELWGTRAGGFHLTNLVLHSANVMLLFRLWQRLTGAFGASAVLAALFAIHPLRIESVVWIAQRKDVLSTFFLLLAFHQYLRFAARRDWKSYACLLLAAVCGLLAKPMLVTLPFMLLLLDYWPLRRLEVSRAFLRSLKPLLLEKAPLIALALAFAATTLWLHPVAGTPESAGSALARLAQAPVNYCEYLLKTILPSGLTPLYPPRSAPSLRAAAALGVVLLASVLAVRAARRGTPAPVFGWLWFLGTLLPVIGLIHVGKNDVSDRFTYVPHLGLFAALTFGVRSWLATRPRWTMAITAAAFLSAVLLAGLTRAQMGQWRNGETLAQRALELHPENPLALNAMASTRDRQGRAAEGLEFAERATKIAPNFRDAHVTAASLLAQRAEYDEAAVHLRAALRLSLRDATVRSQLGAVLFEGGQRTEGLEEMRRAVELDPSNLDARFNLAWALLRSGEAGEARTHLEVLLRSNLADHAAQFAMGEACRELNLVREAVRHYENAARLVPGNAKYAQALQGARLRADALAGAPPAGEER